MTTRDLQGIDWAAVAAKAKADLGDERVAYFSERLRTTMTAVAAQPRGGEAWGGASETRRPWPTDRGRRFAGKTFGRQPPRHVLLSGISDHWHMVPLRGAAGARSPRSPWEVAGRAAANVSESGRAPVPA